MALKTRVVIDMGTPRMVLLYSILFPKEWASEGACYQ